MTKGKRKLPKEKLQALLEQAETALAEVRMVLDVGEVTEEEFKRYVDVATRAVIIKAAITSMEVMR